MNKSRCFVIVLYPENEQDMKTLEYIKKYFKYAYINHKFDIFEEDTEEHKKGDIKKEHIHCLFWFPNPRSLESLKKELNVDYLQSANFYAQSRYLIHLGYPMKHQYNSEEIITCDRIKIENALRRDYNSEEQDSRILLDFLFSHNFCTFRQLTDYAIEQGLLSELQKRTYFYVQFCDVSGFKRY